MELKNTRYKPIGNYAVIGDCHSAALVARDGSIDFCCLPHFDSGAVFCRLLDKDKGGYFEIKPQAHSQSTRAYIAHTNILVTTFQTEKGVLKLMDVMPIRHAPANEEGNDVHAYHRIIRRAKCIEGEITVEMVLKVTVDFARVKSSVKLIKGKGAILASEGHYLAFSFGGRLSQRKDALYARVKLSKGEQVEFVLSHTGAADEADTLIGISTVRIQQEIDETTDYWRKWASTCTYHGPYVKQVMRSALVLKLLTFEPTGAVLAAPTTSLPEVLGGERNWDYRFTWMRDATFTLLALLRLGYTDEARDFIKYIISICKFHTEQKKDIQIMYGINGETSLTEKTLDHLEGYCASRPVRIGNAAYQQKQLDIYGEVMDCLYLFYSVGGRGQKGDLTDGLWFMVEDIIEYTIAHWRDKDAGIWEIRKGDDNFLYSKVMCWVALDRGIKLAEELRQGQGIANWRVVREEIRDSILHEGFNKEAGAFTQAYGSTALDAAALRLPMVGFLPINDAKIVQTIEAIKEKLTHNGLVYRYLDVDDGLAGQEATFSMCTFWLITCLTMMGRTQEAKAWFDQMLTYANDVGLYAEEIDAVTGAQFGNFPQAFTHIALINAATTFK